MNRNLAKLKQFVEKIHKVPFCTFQPLWLVNPNTFEPVTLDLYNSKLNKAYLISGPDDSDRIETCQKHGIAIILVPKNLTIVGSD